MGTEYKLHEYQWKLYNSDKRYLFGIAGIQGGKTTVGALWLMKEISNNIVNGKRGDYLICAPTYKLLEQSTLKKWFDILPNGYGTYEKHKSIYHLANGDDIFIRSAEDPNVIEGMTLLSAWLDEAGQMKSEIWEKIQARLSIKRGKMMITTTPYTLNWLYKLLEYPTDDMEVVSWRSVDSPYFPKEEYERAKKELPQEIFKRRYEGIFEKIEGLIYKCFTEKNICEPFEIPNNWRRIIGLDFGYVNPMAVIFLAISPEGDIYAYDEIYESNKLIKDIAYKMGNKVKNCRYVIGYYDPSAKQEAAELEVYFKDVSLLPANNDVDRGIQKVSAYLDNKKLKIFSNCSNLIYEFKNYQWEENEMGHKEKPLKVDDHLMDAIRYALMSQPKGYELKDPEPSYGTWGWLFKKTKEERVRSRMKRSSVLLDCKELI